MGQSSTSGAEQPDLAFHEVSKHFGDVRAVDAVSLAVAKGSFTSLLGPSGCGKTTLLRLAAGFETPSMGQVWIGAQMVNDVPPHRRPINMVFQHYALFPHLDVAANIAFGLRQRRPAPPATEIARSVGDALALVRLAGYGPRRIWELSGGQQQRVALARALVNRPTVLLLDEPLAALDRKLRRDMQMELQSLQREVGITFVLVTHDQEEALSMSDTIAIMRQGRIVQMGSPAELYDAPVDRYVADFVGESNFFAGAVVQARADGATLRTAGDVVLSAPYPRRADGLNGAAEAVIAVRPEVMRIGAPGGLAGQDLDVVLDGKVVNRIYLGEQTDYSVDTDRLGKILVRVPKTAGNESDFAVGTDVAVGWRHDWGLALRDR